jgi:hypothetical protein
VKKPKTKLEKAKKRFTEEWAAAIFGRYTADSVYKKFRRQLNNLIKLAKQEAIENK